MLANSSNLSFLIDFVLRRYNFSDFIPEPFRG